MALPQSEVRLYRQALRDVDGLAQAALLAQWREFDLADAAQVTAGLLDTLPALVDGYFVVASTVAADWYDVMRADAGARRRFAAILAESPDISRAEALARWAVDPLFKVSPEERATEAAVTAAGAVALSKLAGGLQRVIRNGARETIRRSAVEDPSARGWQRATAADSCKFCRLLAGRGAVYAEASVDFKSHDACNCDAVPAFYGEPKPLRDYTPSQKFRSQSSRDANNARIRAALSE